MASTIFFLAILFLICSTSHSINEGFTISVVHRDSPQSPLYNQSTTLYESRIASVRRSILHAKRLSTSTDLKYDDAEYVASYYIGTPPTQVKAFVDTGSDTIWTMVGVDPPLFNPPNSTTYQTLACKDDSCQLLGPSKTCTEGNEPCSYKITYGYGDDGTTSGVFSRDKFSFDGIEDVGYLNFGCNNEESGFGKLSGCLALNRGELSFVSQLGIKKFSHCWESNGSAIMYFGAKIYPNDLTPFLEGTIQPFY